MGSSSGSDSDDDFPKTITRGSTRPRLSRLSEATSDDAGPPSTVVSSDVEFRPDNDNDDNIKRSSKSKVDGKKAGQKTGLSRREEKRKAEVR